ncbi:baseplate J/gp47 family protein [Aquimarina litoralis]|uniref:baseplate J/gp47 family protein n=1 Tax=Aquimarina litoralis TaxID=584605 RepID=UPI001C577DC3|nr:baseplate J/gp47 family protein [Aquimarina litoralis]MBW1297704.1 hypothetical protein [Aquimarina litoralis]
MSNSCEHNSLLLMRNGTSQSQRCIDALDPESIQLHDLKIEDWMRFAYKFSKKIQYFDTQNNTVSGDWSNFFIKEEEIVSFVEKIKKLEETSGNNTPEKNIEPHLTLFAAFLKLTTFSQERLNSLSKKHLDFYYKEVLKLENKVPVEDKVHILFELAKNAAEVKIDKDTELDGGKDDDGTKRVYNTQEEIVVNRASVTSLRNVFYEEGIGIRNAFVANSYDGLGEDFPDDQIRWWPFGYPTDTLGPTQDAATYPNLPFAKTGFGIASPVLLLKEGKRTITITISLAPFKTIGISTSDLPDAFAIFFSGEKEWIEGEIDVTESSITSGELKLTVVLNEGLDPIVGYNQEILLEPYNTTNPVARFLIKNSATDTIGNNFQNIFSSTNVNGVTIDVSVDSIQDITVENDLGVLDASKPFYPFGPQPKKGSNFFIGLPEALDKNWTEINIDFSWKDKSNLVENYIAYRNEFIERISKDRYTLTLDVNGVVGNPNSLTSIVATEDYFTSEIQVLENGVWESKDLDHLLFSTADRNKSTIQITRTAEVGTGKGGFLDFIVDPFPKFPKGGFIFQSKIPPKEKFSASIKKGFVKLILNQSFLHDLFPKIFSVALSKENVSNTLIPNAPYTPQIETIKVGYAAQASTIDANIQLFHEHPFGISEESEDLKKESVLAITNPEIKLLPSYKKGTLFIGIENAENLQSVSLLVQTLEGSENPETTNDFAEGEKLDWSILCDNEWLSLNRDYIISNNTDNFLKSGIVKFSIPKEATKENTKLPSGSFWVKVENPRDFDTVSQLIDIKAQAVLAQFQNNNNNLNHLQYGIPAGTISKLVERLANVKGITQDYGSFEGKPKETDKEFYRRISERLRHKQRAITIWDYEHLVLQEFADIYKVNCLNHTSLTSFLSPGDVTLVVIPNIINQNVYDPYKPRISKAKRNAIQDFANKLNTLHVTAQVINPVYEEVKVSLKAKFYEGKDENFYSTQLQKDIAKLLAPWAFEETSVIDFGVTLHESMVINYIEKLSYVDYITNFQLLKETGIDTATGKKIFGATKKVIPSSAKVILTSVEFTKHVVNVVTPSEECTSLTINN